LSFWHGFCVKKELVEATMEKDKLKKMLLLDLCAFTASLFAPEAREEVLEDYNLAYNLAERQNLPNRKAYKDLLERF
jgi:hypothetical protein